MMNWLKIANAFQTIDTSDLIKKSDYDIEIREIEMKLLTMIIVISIFLLKNVISCWKIILQ